MKVAPRPLVFPRRVVVNSDPGLIVPPTQGRQGLQNSFFHHPPINQQSLIFLLLFFQFDYWFIELNLITCG